MTSGARSRWLANGLLVLALFAAVLLLGDRAFSTALFSRHHPVAPLHADEAGQWSLLCGGRPHSETADRFHGPVLVQVARGACALVGADPANLSENSLRLVPLLLGLTLAWPFLRRRKLGPALLAIFAVLPMGRFIQEPILATALTWAAILWLRADEASPERARRWRAAAGAFAGLALACKVTAALYLGVAALAYLWVDRREEPRRGRSAFALAAFVSWVLWQSSWLRDLPALVTWWSQLTRAFGVASGVSAEPLRLVTVWPWIISGLCLAAAVVLRWGRAGLAWGRHALDPLLFTAAAIYLIHLALPYQTPWLMLSVDTLVLVVLLPGLLSEDFLAQDCRGLRLWAILMAAVCAGRWVSLDRYAYVETLEGVPSAANAIRSLPGASGLVIQVSGTNYWPLPYYLRGLRVGYGDFAGAERADVRWIEAAGTEAPSAPGYRVFPVEMRSGELWWLLVREPLAPSFATLRAAVFGR